MLSQMSVFLNEVNPCLPPHYSAMDIFAGVFEDELVPTIESKWRGEGEGEEEEEEDNGCSKWGKFERKRRGSEGTGIHLEDKGVCG